MFLRTLTVGECHALEALVCHVKEAEVQPFRAAVVACLALVVAVSAEESPDAAASLGANAAQAPVAAVGVLPALGLDADRIVTGPELRSAVSRAEARFVCRTIDI